LIRCNLQIKLTINISKITYWRAFEIFANVMQISIQQQCAMVVCGFCTKLWSSSRYLLPKQ